MDCKNDGVKCENPEEAQWVTNVYILIEQIKAKIVKLFVCVRKYTYQILLLNLLTDIF